MATMPSGSHCSTRQLRFRKPDYGIHLLNAVRGVDVLFNEIVGHGAGIWVKLQASDNVIMSNVVVGSSKGIRVDGHDNTIVDNAICTEAGQEVMDPGVYANNIWFEDPATSPPAVNIVGGTGIGGNFYTGYALPPYSNADTGEPFGFGDIPFVINGSVVDDFPLIPDGGGLPQVCLGVE